MSSERELDEGIKSIKSAWRREHTARANLEKMLQQAETENARLREQNDKLTNVVGCLMYVKPRDVTSILVNGKVHRIDELLADAGLRWEDA